MDATTADALHEIARTVASMSRQLAHDAARAIEAGGNYAVMATERHLIALHLVEGLADCLAETARALDAIADAPGAGPVSRNSNQR